MSTEGAVPPDHTIRFGPFCLRPAAQLLLEGETPVHLGTRALELLIVLVEQAGRVVTKDELFARVWSGVVVDEGNLRTQVALLRKALRDGQAGARYLTTVPGRGYRFVAPISTIKAPDAKHSRASSSAAAPSLPNRLTRLIGRTATISDILGRLTRHRFVTIVGPGGIGKTSVAVAVAERAAPSYRDGVLLADYGPLLGTSLVAQKLAATLGLDVAEDDPTRSLTAHLRDKQMLIVLDCCERVAESAAVLIESLLKDSAGTAILATSREPLRAEGESVYRLAPLEIPPPTPHLTATDALTYPAVELFVERARSSVNQFELRDSDATVVADICRSLDGIALAIELAAGRVASFGLLGVAARLQHRLRLLTHGRRTAPARHQTLAAALDWSYETLSEAERAALRRLSVYAAGFTLDAAQAVATDVLVPSAGIVEIVDSLVSKSLLNADVTTEISRYRPLDMTREYALEKLMESGEFDQTARRHAKYITSLLERASAEAASATGSGGRLAAESNLIDEARAAIDWAFSSNGDIDDGVALAVANIPLWTHLSLHGESRRYVQQALLAGKSRFGRHDRRQMQLLAALGASLVWTRGPGPEADSAFKEALQIAEALDDADYQIRVLWGLWSSHFNSGRISLSLDTATRFRDVSANHGDSTAALVGERTIGMSLFYLGDHTNARRHTELLLDRYVRPKDLSHIVRFQFDPRIVARTLRTKLLWAQGFPDRAMEEAHGVVDEAGAVGHAMSLALALAQGACPVTLLCGKWTAAEHFINLLLNLATKHALDLWHGWGKCFGALLMIGRGETEPGLQTLQVAIAELPEDAFFVRYAGIQAAWAEALGRVGSTSRAHAIVDQALVRSERDGERWYCAEFLRIKGYLLQLENSPSTRQEAEAYYQRSIDCAREQQVLSWQLRASFSLARLYQEQGRLQEARNALEPVYGRFNEGLETADLMAARTLLTDL